MYQQFTSEASGGSRFGGLGIRSAGLGCTLRIVQGKARTNSYMIIIGTNVFWHMSFLSSS